MKKPFDRNAEWNTGIAVMLVVGVLGIVLLATFIGNAATHDGQGGVIYGLNLVYDRNPVTWTAVYGFAVDVNGFNNPWQFDFAGGTPIGQNNERNLIFECFEEDIDHELYASHVPLAQIDTSNVVPATAAEIDAFMGIDASSFMSANRTFSQTQTFELGINTIVAPATFTYKTDEDPATTFDVGILKDSNDNIIIATHILVNFTEGFNDRLYNYQILLPIPNGTNQTYYFWTDPFDQCPTGTGALPNAGKVEGVVTDENGAAVNNVIIEVAGITNITDNTGNYSITTPAGSYNIFAVKTGYKIYRNNLTIFINQTTIHNIILIIDEDPTVFVGPGQSDGQDDPGDTDNPGQVDPVPVVVQRPQQIEGSDYIISISEIRRKLRIDNFLQEVVRIISFKQNTAQITFTLVGDDIKRLISLDKTSSLIEPNGQDNLVLTIFGQPPVGTYNGSLVIGGDLNETIPIEIEILTKTQLPVEALFIDLQVNNNKVNPGGKLRFTTDLRNLLIDRQYPVNLFYTIQDVNGQTYWSFNTSTYLKTSFSLNKKVELPKDLPLGDYVLRVSASYLGLHSGTSTQIEVTSTFWNYRIFGKVPVWWILAGIAFILAVIAVVIIVKKKIAATQRYHLKVYYNELPKPGPRTVFVGKIAETDTKAYFNLENFKTHTIVAGSTGGGKSFAAQGIIEGMLDKDVAVLAIDPTAQWTGMLRKLTNKTILGLYPQFGMKKSEAKAYNGNIRQIDNPLEIVDIKKYMKPGEIQVFACHKLDPKDIDIFVANTIREVFRQGFDESQNLRLVMLYDEVHRLLPKFGGSGEGFLQIERACREFRKWGIGMALISQVLADFVGQIKANINTEVQMRTRDEGDLDRIKTKYGGEVLQSLVKASVGTGMVENPAYNHGKPYFITFRPIKHSVQRLNDEEIAQYNKFNDQIDQLEYELAQLEEEKIDVFDLKLELKLALDKVKSGNFNMVQIYLEGLTPRIQKHWDKVGKKPKKFERKVALKEDILAAVAKAKEESNKSKEGETAKAEAAKAEAAKAGEKKEAGKKKEDKFAKQVELSEALQFSNGAQVTTMMELMDVLEGLDPATFKASLSDKNIIEEWVRDKLGYAAFAAKLTEIKTKADFMTALKAEQATPTKEGGEEVKEKKEDSKEESDGKAEETSEEKKATKKVAKKKESKK